jgi:hypothetical protein
MGALSSGQAQASCRAAVVLQTHDRACRPGTAVSPYNSEHACGPLAFPEGQAANSRPFNYFWPSVGGRDAPLVLDLALHHVDGVARLHVQGDGLAHHADLGRDTDLHADAFLWVQQLCAKPTCCTSGTVGASRLSVGA